MADVPTREQRNEARNAILDTWAVADYRQVFERVNPFQLIAALDDAIAAVWRLAPPHYPDRSTEES